jgi:hypothetical protein
MEIKRYFLEVPATKVSSPNNSAESLLSLIPALNT